MRNWMKEHGLQLVDNGYQIVPIIPFDADHAVAGKAPAVKDWRTIKADAKKVNNWAARKPKAGIGINTTTNPAVDIDSVDEEAVAFMQQWITENIGLAPVRVGNAPKTLLMFRADAPFTKVKSSQWIDPDNEKKPNGKKLLQAVEILAEGEQFVAYGIHPDTLKPYEWIGVDNPCNLHSELDLDNITLTDARVICDQFDRWVMENRPTWIKAARPMRGMMVSGATPGWEEEEEDGEFMDEQDLEDLAGLKWERSTEELIDFLADYPNDGGYDDWIRVIAAVKAAEHKPDDFKEIAREWSQKSELHDDDYFEQKWEKGQFRRQLGEVANLNRIVANAEREQIRKKADKEVKDDIIPAFKEARTIEEWQDAADKMRAAQTFGIQRDAAGKIAIEAFNRISEVKLSAKEILKYLAFDWSTAPVPHWLSPWVYIGNINVMYNRKNGARRSPQAFDLEFAPETAHIGTTPMIFARKMRPVPAVQDIVYRPLQHGGLEGNIREMTTMTDDPDMFEDRGQLYLNTFDPKSIVEVPEEVTKGGQKAMRIVEEFFRVQIPDENERHHLLDWISYIVSKPGHRVNYAPLILGGEGSGKSIVKKMFEHILGPDNVGTVSNEVIHKSFNYWAEGNILKIIEEISAADGSGGYDLLNKLKEPITNERLQTERKGKDAMTVVNTASWMAYTNDPAALPMGKDASRYMVVASRFRSKDEVNKYLEDHPDFFTNFEKAFTKYPGAVRKFFMSWERSPKFDPIRRAPETTATKQMQVATQTEFGAAIQDAIDNCTDAGVTPELINLGYLATIALDCGLPRPAPRRIARIMSQMGYYPIIPGTPTQISTNGVRGVVYAREPEKWRDGDMVNFQHIRRHFKAHMKKVEANSQEWDDDVEEEEEDEEL
ncbi:hypothetical protein [Aeromonas phage BUCT552]|nr:hypothetical protein [Aeromonas phage BUCT552]